MSEIFSRVNSGSKCWRSRSSEERGGRHSGRKREDERGGQRERDKEGGRKISNSILLFELKTMFEKRMQMNNQYMYI